jgi:hypothetical protein
LQQNERRTQGEQGLRQQELRQTDEHNRRTSALQRMSAEASLLATQNRQAPGGGEGQP